MALIKKTGDSKAANQPKPEAGTVLKGGAKADPAAAKFEQEPGAGAASGTTDQPAAAAGTTAGPASTGTAVEKARPNAGALVVPAINMMDVIKQHKDRHPVDWNTLDRIQATNGNFVDVGQNKASMGDEIQLQLLSWQDGYQVSPGSDEEASKEHVRYSTDGVTTSQGENIAEYLAKLQQIYPKASCDHRVTIAGVLVGSAKDSRLEGELVQIDLSKTSRQEFDKYQIGTAFKVGKGVLTAEQATLMTMKAVPTSWKGKDWTLVKFEPTVLPAA